MDEDVFAVDQYVDCVYLEKYDRLLVLSKPNTEQIFNFKSYYEKYTKQDVNSIKKMGFVEIDSDLIIDTLKSIALVKRMTKLQHSNAFDKDFKHFKSAYDHIKGNSDYKTDKCGLLIIGNKVIIGKEKTKFESFLYLCDNGVVEYR